MIAVFWIPKIFIEPIKSVPGWFHLFKSTFILFWFNYKLIETFLVLVNYLLRYVQRLVHHFLCWLILHLIINKLYRIILAACNLIKTSSKTTGTILSEYHNIILSIFYLKETVATRFYLNYNRSTEVLCLSTTVLLSKWFIENDQIDLIMSLLSLIDSWLSRWAH